MDQATISRNIIKGIEASDRAASMLKWRQENGIMVKSVRIDVRLDQPVSLTLRQLEALSAALAEMVKSAKRLDSEQDQISMIGAALRRERYKLIRHKAD